MKSLLLDELRVDYITATYFPEGSGHVYEQLRDIALSSTRKRVRGARRLQYTGEYFQGSSGTCFLGSGEQKGKCHVLFQASGDLADHAWATGIKKLAVAGWVRLTRIDLQVTTYKPATLHLRELYERAVSSHNTLSYIESCAEGERLATLYYGSRTSERFWRFYEKPGQLGLLIRAELELKGAPANQVPGRLSSTSLSQVFNGYLARLPWQEIRDLFRRRGIEEGNLAPVRAVPDTEGWLLGTVAPALARFLETDPDPTAVIGVFEGVLERYYKYRSA